MSLYPSSQALFNHLSPSGSERDSSSKGLCLHGRLGSLGSDFEVTRYGPYGASSPNHKPSGNWSSYVLVLYQKRPSRKMQTRAVSRGASDTALGHLGTNPVSVSALPISRKSRNP